MSDLVGQGPTTYTSFRTPGSTAITNLPLVPLQNDRWVVYAVGVQGYLFFQSSKPSYGRLGRIVTGIIPFQSPQAIASGTIQPVSPFGNPPWQPLPEDPSLVSTLWDDSIDDMPPIVTNGQPPALPLPISTTITPPVPRALQAGDAMALGIWMEPSILGKGGGSILASDAVGFILAGASFTISYEDNVK